MHLDLDAFFAAVEQRDKPSLRGKPVCVGGIGPRGVVATASYEARVYGAHSAMPTAEARRLCPAGTAFLHPRGAAYRKSSQVVMDLLREISPVVEPVSVDEAYVDLAPSGRDLSPDAVAALARDLIDRIQEATGGLGASAGIASSKLLAKIGSDLEKPHGLVVVPPGHELDVLAPLSVRVIAGVGPATARRLRSFGIETVADLQRMQRADLVSILGEAHGAGLHEMAFARDDRDVVVEREAKSVSSEETFQTDISDRAHLEREVRQLADRVTSRVVRHAVFARTVSIKVRHHDFSTITRAETLAHPTGDPAVVTETARRLLDGVDVSDGIRLLGVGVSGLSDHAQEQIVFEEDVTDAAEPAAVTVERGEAADEEDAASGPIWGRPATWTPGQDVTHDDHGSGWVWGRGLGRVTVRFEGPTTGPGPIHTFRADDPALHPAEPPSW